ncbi:lipopolysaccharide biosynthesis protein [Sphingomonas sp. PB4P5]|uniref:lipopolysaccharide biosynthesis protein n=1 Tax=Parasphingomonas puruogangriensis TaxID=3096155 RepID=UPI002FCB19BF
MPGKPVTEPRGQDTPNLSYRAIYRRVAGNAGYLLGSTGVVVLAGILQVAINARALGPALLGLLVLAQTYAMVLERLFTFDTWQPLITLGARQLDRKDHHGLRDALALAVGFDLAAAFCAGMLGLLLVRVAGPWLGVAPQQQVYLDLMSLSLFFRVSGATTGLLRLFDRFSVLAALNITDALVRLAASILLMVFHAELFAYVATFAALTVALNLAMCVVALVLWRRRGLPLRSGFAIGALRTQLPEFGKISSSSFVMSSINALRSRADVFMLAGLVGPTAVGLYAIAQRVSSIAGRVADPLGQVAYPEISRLAAAESPARLKRVLSRFFLIGLGAGIVFVLGTLIFAPLVIRTVAGPGFEHAATPLYWLMAAFAIFLAGFWIRAAAMNVIGAVQHLYTYVVAFAAMMAIGPWAVINYGLVGAGASQLVFNLVWFLTNTFLIVRALSRAVHTKPSLQAGE